MSDMTDDFDNYDCYDCDAGDPDPFKTVRKREWITKAGDGVRICDMTDKHLLNAFNLTKDETLFSEMVWRLFEQRIKEVQT
jgi:hypothetical protein